MAAMNAAGAGDQFLSRVLGYERLRVAQDRLKESARALRARLDTLRCGLPDPGSSRRPWQPPTDRCAAAEVAGRRHASAVKVVEGGMRSSGPAGRGAETARGGRGPRVATSAWRSRTWRRRDQGRRPGCVIRAAGGDGGGGAHAGARSLAQAPLRRPARGGGVADAGRRGQHPARRLRAPSARNCCAGARRTREAARRRRPASRSCESATTPLNTVREARDFSLAVARGTAHALGAGHAGRQDKARGAPRSVQGSRGAARSGS